MDDDELLRFLNETNNNIRSEIYSNMDKENHPMESSKVPAENRKKRSKINTVAIFPVKDGSLLSICHLDKKIASVLGKVVSEYTNP